MVQDRASVRFACAPGEGDACGCTWVMNVYVADCPDDVWVAETKSPPVLPTSIGELPEAALEGLRLVGCVKNAKASCSVLNGIVTRTPAGSPSTTWLPL